jgi:hypothetical protein
MVLYFLTKKSKQEDLYKNFVEYDSVMLRGVERIIIDI